MGLNSSNEVFLETRVTNDTKANLTSAMNSSFIEISIPWTSLGIFLFSSFLFLLFLGRFSKSYFFEFLHRRLLWNIQCCSFPFRRFFRYKYKCHTHSLYWVVDNRFICGLSRDEYRCFTRFLSIDRK